MQPIFTKYKFEDHEWGIALVDIGDFLNYDEAAEGLYSEHRRAFANVDILIVRPSVDISILDVNGETANLQGFRDRMPRASLHLLYSDAFAIKISENLNPIAQAPEFINDNILTWLCETELRAFLHQSAACFEARDNFVYRSPSGSYCRTFLRVGNVQTTRHKLDAFFFWMLPFLRNVNAIITETWSISSIALNIAFRLQRYDVNRGACDVDMLSSYHDGSSDLIPETIEVLRRVGHQGRRVLVLLSAVATGNSLARLRETISRTQIQPDQFSYLALYRLHSDIDIDTLCDLSSANPNEAINHPLSSESIDRVNTTVIEIDRQTYFPLQILDSTVGIREKMARPARDFFDQYKGKEVISLHRDMRDKNGLALRHHGIYIDVEVMLSLDRFRQQFKQMLSNLTSSPALIIVPPHHAGISLAKFASDILRGTFQTAPRIIIHPDLHPLADDTPKDAISHLSETDSILILDDVSITGQRLARYQKHLRELNYPGRIFYLVGVARPASESEWTKRERNLRYRRNKPNEPHQVYYTEKVIIPDWAGTECPWCKEQEALRILLKEGDRLGKSRNAVAQRLNLLLRSIAQGLKDNALWCGSRRPPLTSNSIFLENNNTTEADVIAAVAAAIQQMRISDAENKLEATYPHITVIDSNDYLGTTFTDNILRLAIIRTAKKCELERWSDSEEEKRRKAVRALLTGPHVERDEISFELAVAMLDHKIPRPTLSESDWENLEATEYGAILRRIIAGFEGE